MNMGEEIQAFHLHFQVQLKERGDSFMRGTFVKQSLRLLDCQPDMKMSSACVCMCVCAYCPSRET